MLDELHKYGVPDVQKLYVEGFEQFTWVDFDDAIKDMVAALKGIGIRNIYGIPRGGLVVAVALSHQLNLPLSDSVGLNTLVVDDISDTGKTLAPYKEHLTATIHYRRGSEVQPDIWVRLKTDKWILYPWERYQLQATDVHRRITDARVKNERS